MKRLLRYFLRGLVLLAPLAVTIYICVVTFQKIDGWLPLRLTRAIPGAGFAITLVLITLFGFIASNFFTRRAVTLLERVMERLPLVRLLYTSTRDLLNAFVGERRRFDRPVLVALGAGGELRVFGFMTQASLVTLGLPGHVAVYFPQSYHFAGNLVVVRTEQVTALDAESSAVMAFIVSGGVTELPSP